MLVTLEDQRVKVTGSHLKLVIISFILVTSCLIQE